MKWFTKKGRVMLEIVQVSVGRPEVIGRQGGVDVISSIRKRRVREPNVMVGPEGIAGDEQADKRIIKGKRVHGGPIQAVYVYPVEHLEPWAAELGIGTYPALFGENITVRGATEAEVRIGDEFVCGDVRYRVTKPRRPCYKLPIHLGVPEASVRMRDTGRTGWYFEVVRPGLMPTSGALELVLSDPSQPTVAETFVAKRRADPSIPGMPKE